MSQDLLQVRDLVKHFPVETSFLSRVRGGEKDVVHAVDGVSFSIRRGETLGLVGETGSGKTTIARLIMRLIDRTSGEVVFEGKDVFSLDKKELHSTRRDMQIIFQDPFASLNPRMTVREIVELPLQVHGIAEGDEKRKIALDLLEKVGLSPAQRFIDRYPHEFSGGQRQRIGIARALALKPKFVVADEPVSALDMSIRSQILNLMQDLRTEFGLTYLLIAHDLSVVRYMSDWIGVLYLGKIVELARCEDFFLSPQHTYSKALIAAIPVPDPTLRVQKTRLKGEMPSPIHPPKGCRFHTRCPFFTPECRDNEPQLVDIGRDHMVACHRNS